MKSSRRAKIGIFEKKRVKNLRGGGSVRFDLKKTRLFRLVNVEKPLIRNLLSNGRLRVWLQQFCSFWFNYYVLI